MTPQAKLDPSHTLSDDTFYLNMGPQHPSTHGVLRLLLRLSGERIMECDPVLGYSHRGQEHIAQNKTYLQFLPYPGRMDYLAALMFNHAHCLAIEKAAGIAVPERAEYIRTICAELNRISSHLLWLGAYLMDLGAFTPFLYCFDDREDIMDLLLPVTGSRLTYCYCRFGGVAKDVDADFVTGVRAFIKKLRGRMKDYDKLVNKNVIFINRTKDVGVISQETALAYGLTGPCLRGSGVAYDVRRAEPYGVYPELAFDIPVFANGDCLDRYMVRFLEMEQSLRIIEQALDRLPEGPIAPAKPVRVVKVPVGDYLSVYESARGQVGIYLVSDGGKNPYRMKWRVPSFSNLSVLPMLLVNTLVADTIAILGSVDVVMPEIDR